MAYDDPDNNPFSERNQRAHIRAHFSSATGEAPTSYDVKFTADETIEVYAPDAPAQPWVFEIPSDDDGNYYFCRGQVVLSFPYPGE